MKPALAHSLHATFVGGTVTFEPGSVTFPVAVQPKIDGFRCYAIKVNGKVTLHNRSGGIITTLPRIVAALEELPYDDLVLDGEVAGESFELTSAVIKANVKRKSDDGIVFHVFDSVSLRSWTMGRFSRPFTDRMARVFEIVPNSHPIIRAVDTVTCGNEEQLSAHTMAPIADGYEGAMIRCPHAPYIPGRSRAILKVKPVATIDGVVVGTLDGKGKHKGRIGALVVRLPNGITTDVGTGLSDADRMRDDWPLKIIECAYQPDPHTSNGLTAQGRMRFPTYLRTRETWDQ